ncbi:MAG: hypothetical protein V3S64_17170 [bacterium]
MMTPLFNTLSVLSALAGMGLFVAVPGIPIFATGHLLMAGAIHLFTAGALLSAAFQAEDRLWRKLYGWKAPFWLFREVIFPFQLVGVVTMVWGFLNQQTLAAHTGGHYLLPVAIVLSIAHGIVAAWRREPGRPLCLAAHLPGVGLAVTGSIGALLVMDARTGNYGIYSNATVLVHMMSGGFLFAIPLALLPGALFGGEKRGEGGEEKNPPWLNLPGALAKWYVATAVAAAGVMAMAFSTTAVSSMAVSVAAYAPRAALPGGLGLLGGLLLFIALPERLAWGPVLEKLERRAGWLAAGLLLLYTAIRLGRGVNMAEVLMLTKTGVIAVLAGVALPEMFLHSLLAAHPEPREMGIRLGRGLFHAGTAALLAGQYLSEPDAIQAGAVVWMTGLGVWVYRALVNFSIQRRTR